MDDYISREAAIKRCEALLAIARCNIAEWQTHTDEYKKVVSNSRDRVREQEMLDMIDYLKTAPAADVRHAPEWISVKERLPENGEIVLASWWNIHCCDRNNVSVMRFRKGRTAEELKDAKLFTASDQWGNNKKPYKWEDPHGPLSLFGQDVTHWMPLPEPPEDAING